MELSWSRSYGSWIYNYLCNQCLSPLTLWVRIPLRRGVFDTTLCDKVCQGLATGQWFSLGNLVSSTNKTDCHNITAILLKVVLNTINHKLILIKQKIPHCRIRRRQNQYHHTLIHGHVLKGGVESWSGVLQWSLGVASWILQVGVESWMKSSRIHHPSIRLAWYSTLNYGLFDMIDVVWNVDKIKNI